MIRDSLLDTSNYPVDHRFFSNTLKARLGCVKDECRGDVAEEWILLTPKCYSMKLHSEKEIKRSKGVQRAVIQRQLRHQHYRDVYMSNVPAYFETTSFISCNHQISTVSKLKKCLSLFDDKRYWLDKNHSIAYGHYFCDLFDNNLL